MFARYLGRVLGLEQAEVIDRIRPALGAEWATEGSGPFWLFLAVVAIIGTVFLFYIRFQQRGPRWVRHLLAICRALLLVMLLFTLAEPALKVIVSHQELPELFVVCDGTASMELRDEYEPAERQALQTVTGLTTATTENASPSRQEYLAAWLTRGTELENRPNAPLAAIEAAGICRMRVFLFDGQYDSRLRELSVSNRETNHIDWHAVSAALTTTGEVTAIGSVLRDLGRQRGRQHLAGVVLISDFGHNAGEHPASVSTSTLESPLRNLGVPLHCITVGAAISRDLAVTVEPETKIRRGEQSTVNVRIRQTQMLGESVQVRLFADSQSDNQPASGSEQIDSRTVTLEAETTLLEIPYFPQRAGDVELRAEVDVVPGEIVTDNNRSVRRVQITDDYIRLLYVAYEPTWEWRFVKEVFHRDPAVGLRGFRTYLASSDPRVRESNPLFLPTLAQRPRDFFANDVIFLDDVPRSNLTPRFCHMLEQFVRDFGGGLVVIAGPRFGPSALSGTALEKMLPVIIDPNASLRDEHDFMLQLTSRAGEYPFMKLDEDPVLNRRAWDNLAKLPWYQPVAHHHEQAVVLADHPTDTCRDGKTPQPLIAVRRYGAGEVVYLGFNETWRLRKSYGDKYYRRFWLPMIDRLGLSHALGVQKRFVVRTDRLRYRVEDELVVTVHAYDENYQPLAPESLENETLAAELIQVNHQGQAADGQTLRIDAIRAGFYEARVPLMSSGTFRVRVLDPITKRYVNRDFSVAQTSAEFRSSVRNDSLAQQLSDDSQGFFAPLHLAGRLSQQLDLSPIRVTEEHSYAIWNTLPWFVLIALLMIIEWLLRKWVHLA